MDLDRQSGCDLRETDLPTVTCNTTVEVTTLSSIIIIVVTLVHHNTTFLLVQVPSILHASAGVFALEHTTAVLVLVF